MSEYNFYNIKVPPEFLEQMGTKEKYWFHFSEENSFWLFKYSREGTGEHWSEKVAEKICQELCIPHARYELAETNSRPGVITKNIIPKDSKARLVMGNEILHSTSPNFYPQPRKPNEAFVRVKQHTVNRVMKCLDNGNILPPVSEFDLEDLDAGDVFCGYLMLDTLISNQDRHHENWAIIIDNAGIKTLSPTYDHAASLGRELLDQERLERLQTKDKNRQIESFVKKAKSELFGKKTDNKVLSLIDAFFLSVNKRKTPRAKIFWLHKLRQLQHEKLIEIFNNIPNSLITQTAKEFAIQMVLQNQKRLLEDERT